MKDTIIFDLDGTLALIEHRRHFVECEREKQDWDAFYEACDRDAPNMPIIQLLNYIPDRGSFGKNILIFSGRSDKVLEKTKIWLDWNRVRYDGLRMRPDGDFTPDDELKKKWAMEYGVDRIAMVFDDRDKVVKMWRSLGLTCLQVAPGDF